uniref:ZP domain-containing protein n=1 Tax=Parascaris equorum TaxID=6256 RepID=A0A914RE02_PAREQ
MLRFKQRFIKQVECGDSALSLVFTTRTPFMGRVYVRGLADDERCFRSFADNLEQTTFSIVIQIGDCAMQKQRIRGSLEGVMFSLTVIVSFHSTFVTTADRAYRCMCFFRTIKRLNSAIDMVPISALDLHSSMKVPSCSYTIHTESVEGPEVMYARLNLNPMLEKAMGYIWKRYISVDADGCPIDRTVQPNLEYDLKYNRV